MDYIVIKVINWQYSAGNTPDMKIDEDSRSEPMDIMKAIATMQVRNKKELAKDTPQAWVVLPKDAYEHLLLRGMYNS